MKISESPYSFHFKMLTLMGAWTYDTDNEMKIIIFALYRTVATISIFGAIFSLLVDLHNVFGDFKKMAWNLCVTILIVGTMSKVLILLKKIYKINQLRRELHKDEQSRTSPDDVFIHNIALKEMKLLRILFYGSGAFSVFAWVTARYLEHIWGSKELPVPFSLPDGIDLNDNQQYNIAFGISAICGMFGVLLVSEVELAMFSIMVQISREYRILMKDIPKINNMYEESYILKEKGLQYEEVLKEINPWLKREKTKVMVKDFCRRQQQIIKYTKDFEFCYNISLLFQFFGVSALIVLNALQCLLYSEDLSGNLLYELGYLAVNMMDLYLICWFSTRLETQCFEIGETAYSTLWYRMSMDIQRDIGMIILRSQNPPKITSGKLMEMNLINFMHRMSNLYSWLALFRQLEFKFNS